MSVPEVAKLKFDGVLRKEGLDDPSIFDSISFLDELPLYSRYSQVEPLSNFGEPNELLLELALNYLDRITRQHKSRRNWFAAVTIRDDPEDDYIVPHIFVCNGDVRARMAGLLLHKPSGALAKFIGRAISGMGRGEDFLIREDRDTVPGSLREFIGYSVPPDRMIAMDSFANGDGEAARQSQRRSN